MGLVDFAAGYTLGAKAGNRGFDDLLDAGREVVSSREFQALLSAARSHAAATLKQLGDLVEGGDAAPPVVDNVLDLVKALVERREGFLTILTGGESGATAEPTS